jgi:hypothetical protein
VSNQDQDAQATARLVVSPDEAAEERERKIIAQAMDLGMTEEEAHDLIAQVETMIRVVFAGEEDESPMDEGPFSIFEENDTEDGEENARDFIRRIIPGLDHIFGHFYRGDLGDNRRHAMAMDAHQAFVHDQLSHTAFGLYVYRHLTPETRDQVTQELRDIRSDLAEVAASAVEELGEVFKNRCGESTREAQDNEVNPIDAIRAMFSMDPSKPQA